MPPPVPKLKPALGGADGCCCDDPKPPGAPNPPGAGFCAGAPKVIGAAPAGGWAVPKVVGVLLKVGAVLFPKGCGAAAGEPNGTGAGAGVEPNVIAAGAPKAGAAGAEPNVVDGCAGADDPKFIAFAGAGVDPNPPLGAVEGVDPKVIGAAGVGAVEPNGGAAEAGAGVDPNVKGAAGVGPGAGVEPNAGGAAGAGVEPKLGAGVGAGVLAAFPNEGGAGEVPKPEVVIDELSSFEEFVDGFPKTKGTEAGAAGAPPDSEEATGASLDILDPNDMLG